MADGKATRPGYSFTSDLDTGMWRPANDSLSFQAGTTEAIRIISGGNVGIGSVSPAAKLDVAGTIKSTGLYTGQGLQIWKGTIACVNATEYKVVEMNGTYWMGYLAISVMCQHGSNSGGFWDGFFNGYGGGSATVKFGNAGVTMRVAATTAGKEALYITTNYDGSMVLSIVLNSARGDTLVSDYLSAY